MSQRYRKRKIKNDNSFVIPANYKFVIIIGALVIIGLAYYLIDAQRQIEIRDTGYRMNALRQEIQKAKNLNSDLRARLAELKKLDRVIAKLESYGIKLSVPPIQKVYRIKLYDGVEGLGKRIVKNKK